MSCLNEFFNLFFPGPPDYHPISSQMFRADLQEIDTIIDNFGENIVKSFSEGSERQAEVIKILDMFNYTLHKLGEKVTRVEKRELFVGEIEKKMQRTEQLHSDGEGPLLREYSR